MKSILIVIMLFPSALTYAQNDSSILAAADTSGFSVNRIDGWLIYNSYVSEHGQDSAQLELVIRHDDVVNWKKEHYIGKIKFQTLKPQASQTILYYLLNDQYALRIDETGKCYFKFISGAVPSANPVVIPIRLVYKK